MTDAAPLPAFTVSEWRVANGAPQAIVAFERIAGPQGHLPDLPPDADALLDAHKSDRPLDCTLNGHRALVRVPEMETENHLGRSVRRYTLAVEHIVSRPRVVDVDGVWHYIPPQTDPQYTANFGESSFIGEMPDGYSAWVETSADDRAREAVPEDHQQRAADEVKAATQRLNEAIRAAAAASLVVEVSTFDMREMQQPRPVPRLVVRISRDL